jgi:hypothetical protein
VFSDIGAEGFPAHGAQPGDCNGNPSRCQQHIRPWFPIVQKTYNYGVQRQADNRFRIPISLFIAMQLVQRVMKIDPEGQQVQNSNSG